MADTPRRVPALDGLRGLAILSVLAWHYVASLAPWEGGWWGLHAALSYTWSGVDLFFARSARPRCDTSASSRTGSTSSTSR